MKETPFLRFSCWNNFFYDCQCLKCTVEQRRLHENHIAYGLTLNNSTRSCNLQSELKITHENALTAVPRFKNVIFRHHYVMQKSSSKGWCTLGLRKAEQSLKTGLFYYDEISTPCSARPCASFAQPKNFYALEGTAQPSSARISTWAGTVLRYSVGIIQEGGVFMPPSWIIPTFAQHFREEEQ